MGFQYTPYCAVLSVTAIISLVVTLSAWRRRSTSARTAFALMMLAITQYATVAALEAAAIAIADKVFWSKLEYVGSSSTITLFLIFTIYFTRHEKWLTLKRLVALWIIPIFNVALVATNQWHHLVWLGFLPGAIGSNQIIYQHGSGFLWIMACVYVYVVAGCLLLIKVAVRRTALYRYQAIAILIGSLVPLLGSTAYMLKLSPPDLNITPMSFLVTGLACFTSIYRFRIFDLVPVARDILIESMSDGVLVLDVKNRIVDINPAAQRLIKTKANCIGQYVEDVLARWPHIIKLCYEQEDARVETFIDGGIPRYVDMRISPLRDRFGHLTGRLVVWHDITQRHQTEVQLRQANERLQSKLQEIETLQVKLKEQALRDSLTGLFNRHYFDEKVPKELTLATDRKYPVALIMMDIDYFKKINDNFGHKAGDLVLQAFGNLLHSQIQNLGIVCRSGGEEFVLVLPRMSWEDAYQTAERIRVSFQDLRVLHGEAEISATISGGIAVFPDSGTTDDELLQVADRALYAAKAAGRNFIKLG